MKQPGMSSIHHRPINGVTQNIDKIPADFLIIPPIGHHLLKKSEGASSF